jgi:hypothetical protein
VNDRRECDDAPYGSSEHYDPRLLYYRCRTYTGTKEETTDMSINTTWRQRRQVARTRRALDRALARTSSPAMRDELLTMANNSGF